MLNEEHEETQAVKDNAFLSWLQENGAVFDKILWPTTATESGSRGAVAVVEIPRFSPIIEIPERLMMTPPQAERLPDIGHVFRENASLLRNDSALALYIMHEIIKGESSFYSPFLRILPRPHTVADWPPSAQAALQDPALRQRALASARHRRTLYERTFHALETRYPGLFRRERYSFALFDFAWGTIEARAFGRRLPWSALVPMADLFNHGNVPSKYALKDGVFRLFASGGDACPMGAEVIISYGRRPNDNLLLDYGFSMLDNEWDEVDLLVALPEETAEALAALRRGDGGINGGGGSSGGGRGGGGGNGSGGGDGLGEEANDGVDGIAEALEVLDLSGEEEEMDYSSSEGGSGAVLVPVLQSAAADDGAGGSSWVLESKLTILISQGLHAKRRFCLRRDSFSDELLRFARVAAMREEEVVVLRETAAAAARDAEVAVAAARDAKVAAAATGSAAAATAAVVAAPATCAGAAADEKGIFASAAASVEASGYADGAAHGTGTAAPRSALRPAAPAPESLWTRLSRKSWITEPLPLGTLSPENEAAAWAFILAALERHLALAPTSLADDEAELRRREGLATAAGDDGSHESGGGSGGSGGGGWADAGAAATEMLHALRYRITAKRIVKHQLAMARAAIRFIAALQATSPAPGHVVTAAAGTAADGDPYAEAVGASARCNLFLSYLVSLEEKFGHVEAEKGGAPAAPTEPPCGCCSDCGSHENCGMASAAGVARLCLSWAASPGVAAEKPSPEEVRWYDGVD